MKAILLVDHGSVFQEANEMLKSVADLLRRQADGVHVEIAHMELAEPTIEQGFDACAAAGAATIIVHPYMLSSGRHATQDIPRLVAAVAAGHPSIKYSITEPLGLHTSIAQVILERVAQAEGEL